MKSVMSLTDYRECRQCTDQLLCVVQTLGSGLGGQWGAGWSPRHTQFSFPQPTEQFNGQGASFNGGSIGYSQPGLSGPSCSIPGYPSSPLPGNPTPPMTPSSNVPYMSPSQEVKSPFLPDLKPGLSSLHPSPSGECLRTTANMILGWLG